MLDKLGKTEKRLEVIKGRLGKHSQPMLNFYLKIFLRNPGRLIRNKDELNHMELECYLSLHRWDDAVVLLTQMLQRNPDQWSHLEVYISCQIQRYKKSVEDAKLEHEKKRKGVAESNGEVEGEVRGVEDREEGAAREEVWEGKGEKEEGDEENGRSEEDLEEKMNQLNISEDGPGRKIPM